MRKNRRYLAATALVLAAALGWTGLRLASGQEVYHAPELVLLEGQAEYDLLAGIEYDAAQYDLSVVDLGGFDIDTLGEYTLRYMLTPLALNQPETPVEPEGPETPVEPEGPEMPVEPEVPETPVEPEVPETPVEPEVPQTPVEPEQPETPVEPEVPETPVEPEEPETPVEPEQPETSIIPEETEEPEASEELLALAKVMDDTTSAGETVTPEVPDTSVEPETPVEPEQPETPVEPEQPETPVEPEQPETPVEPEQPETPVEPEQPETPVEPEQPETPVEPEQPETPVEPEQPETPVEPEQPEESAEPIYFTRQVVVTEAITYEDVRLDQGSEDLLTGITSATEGYQIAVVSDGGFDPNVIEEYEVTYSLRRADNGKELRQFTRYVQVTLPGVEYTAPELVAEGNLLERDWLEGIEYDESRYVLTLLTPPDLTETEPQRLRYSLTTLPQLEQEVSLEPENVVLFSQEVSLDGTVVTPEPDATEPTTPEQGTTEPEPDATEPTTPEQGTTEPEPDGMEPTTPEQDATEPEQPETEGKLAAIFGREVTILAEHLVTIDAPPLVLTLEELATIDLLEGVTATDETGAAVEVTVKDSSELEGTPADTIQGDMPSMSPAGLAEEPSPPANGGLGMAEESQPPANGGLISDTSSLEPGTYTITLAAVHPVTGEEFTVQRTVTLLAVTAGNAKVITEDTTIDVSADPTPIQINGDITLTLTGTGTIYPADDTRNAIDIVTGHTVTIVLEDGANVTLYGKDATAGGERANVGIGGGAALHVPEGVTLYLEGSGTLTAYGGNAARGGDAPGTNAFYGGAGGGGGGAAIGGNGGDGGVGGGVYGTSGMDSPSPEMPGVVSWSSSTTVIETPGEANTYINKERAWVKADAGYYSGCAAGGGGMGATKSLASGTFLGGKGYAGVGGAGGGGGSGGGTPDWNSGNPELYNTWGSYGGGGWNGGQRTYDYAHNGGRGGAAGLSPLPVAVVGMVTNDGTTATYETLANAFEDIASSVESGKEWTSYRIFFLNPDAGYTIQAEEWQQIAACEINKAVDVTISATADGTAATGALTLATATPLVLPYNSQANFVIENIQIEATTASAIAANGSILTMGEGITVTGYLDVVGGGLITANPAGDTYTFTGDTNLTIRSGTYRNVAAGSRPYAKAWAGTVTTQGSNQLTLGGGTDTVTVTNVLGLNLIGYGTNNIANSHTGSSTVTLQSGATVTNLYAGSRGDTYNAYHTDAQTGGAITIQVNDGATIKTLLGGTASTKANGGQLEKVVFQINGTASIPTVQDFDQLILENSANLTVTTKLHYNGSGKEETVAGQVVFGNDSVLKLPKTGAASLTVGSLKTEGEGAMLDVHIGYPLTIAGAAPMDSNGGVLGVKCWNGTPVNYSKLIYYSNADAPMVDIRDYVLRQEDADAWTLSTDATGKYLQFGIAKVRLTAPGGTDEKYSTFATAANALRIMKEQEVTGNFTLSLLANYTWTAADLAAFQDLDNLTAGDSVKINGDPNQTGAGVYTITLQTVTPLILPYNSQASFTIENINIYAYTYTAVAANGSILTMGEGITVTGDLDVVGGGLTTTHEGTDYTFTGNSNLTVQSGNYYFIVGGSRPYFSESGTYTATFNGNTHVVVEGTAEVTYLVGGNYIYATGTPINNTIINGSTYVQLSEQAQATYVGAGGIVYGFSKHATDTVTGTAAVTVSGGTITSTLAGTYAAYTVTSGQLNHTVFTIEGTQSILKVQDFDQLILEDNAHLTVTTKFHYDGSGKEETVAGQVVFGNNSVLTLPNKTAANLTVGSLKTTGAGATLEVYSASYPLTVAGAAPMDSSGGPLGVKYQSGTPANGSRLIYYSNAAAPMVNISDYVSRHEDMATVILTTDAAGDYLQFGTAKVRMTAPDGSNTYYVTFADAFNALYQLKEEGVTGDFTVSLLMDYGDWSEADRASLLALNNLTAQDSVTITGRQDPEQTAYYGFSLTYLAGYVPIAVELPMNSDCPFTLEYISIQALDTLPQVIAANGTTLTMGEGISCTGSLKLVGGAIARDENFQFVDDFTFVGDTNLTLKSGTYSVVAGGNLSNKSNGKFTLEGSVNITVEGPVVILSNSAYGLAGGSYGYESGQCEYTVTGDINITVRGGATIPNLIAGSIHRYIKISSDVVEGTATVTLEADAEGNTPSINKLYGTTQFVAGAGKLNQTVYRINDSMSIDSIYDFDQLVLAKDVQLTVTDTLDHQNAEAEAPAGTVVFGESSTLTLPGKAAANLNAGSLKTAGPNAVLEVVRGYPLDLTSATDSTGGKLTLQFNPSTTAAVNGDKILYFSTQPNQADSSHYLSGFPGEPGLEHDQTTGYVYVATNIITLQTNGGAVTYYPNIGMAMQEIETTNNANNDYTITVRKQHYTVTAEDLQAIDEFNGAANSITFTSTFALTASDILESGESVGKTVTRHVILDGDLSFRCSTILQGIYLEYQGHDGGEVTTGSHNIYANGHALIMANTVDTGSGNYPTLYGGSKTAAVSGTTSLTVQGGQYQDIYGGGEGFEATVGGTNIQYGGMAVLDGSLYGGGKDGDVNGNTSVTIAGGTTGGVADAKVVAGGENGDVSGTAQLTITGGTASKTMVVAGADNGTVNNVVIAIQESTLGVEPSAPRADVYGGAYGTGSVTGDVAVTITNGTYYGTISGGDLDGSMPNGTSTISFSGGDLRMEDLVNFTTLNLGYDSAKCVLSVTGQLDSNTAASGTDNFGRTGAVVFNNGSALNLTGKNVHAVGSIKTTTTNGASHLHITKADNVSYPLYISQGNNSEKGYTINVGIPDSESAPAASRPAEGDDLLIFASEDQVDLSQYLCGLALLAPVQNLEDPAIVELGIAAEVQAKLTGVTHNGKADTTTDGSNKTLSFLFTNISDTGAPGQAPTSAYIDRTATADSDWIAGGNVPSGALGGELTVFTEVSGQDGQWTGQITLDVEALDTQTPRFYYLHVRAPGSNRTIILDVYAPEVTKDVASTANGQGDYTFTIQVQDKAPAGLQGTTPDPENEDVPVYENAGLSQVGWSLTEHDPKALTKPMTIEDVQTISNDNVWLPYEWSFDVTAEQLADADTVGETKVLYLYLQDTLGNTRMITVPMNEHQVDVSIPTRVGVVVMKGTDTPKVSAPQCALINYGSQTLNVSVTQVSFTAEDNELTLVTKSGGSNSEFTDTEINLRIKPLSGEQGYAYSLASLTSTGAAPLAIGQMAQYNAEGTGNRIGFTFDALYNPQTIMETSKWSMFYLSYRFEPVSQPTP